MPVPWKWLKIDGWKSHAVPAYLGHTLIADLRARRNEEIEYEEQDTTNVAIDMPGMIAVDRPWMDFELDGLTVEMPCEDVLAFWSELKNLRSREFTHGTGMGVGMTYYKLHGLYKCIVLTPDLRFQLLEALADKTAQAEMEATAFWAGRKLPAQVLREAAALTSGKEIDQIGDMGGHKQDRFHTVIGKKGDA